MKKPELKLGRPVIGSDDNNLDRVKGVYIHTNDMGVHCLLNAKNHLQYFPNVKPDLSAPPMNGDEVEVSDDGKRWHPPRLYVGKTKDGRHFTGGDFNYDVSSWKYVRFPQQSKREMVLELISPHVTSRLGATPNSIADQIDYIYKEDS